MLEPALRARPRFWDDVCEGLARNPKQLSPMYFYDHLGSALFDAICRLPWYTIPVAERTLLEKHAAAMIGWGPGRSIELVELGPGDGSKLETLTRELLRNQPSVRVGLIDISSSALRTAQERLQALPGVTVRGYGAAYLEGLLMAERHAADTARCVLFLGSNIGNFTPPEASAFLTEVRARLRPGDSFVCGIDLIKDERDLMLAYQDPIGLTAAFNKNILLHINRELGADFDLDQFRHAAAWNPAASRMEMHLVSERKQTVQIGTADRQVRFEAGETIWTESSYKYTRETADRLFAGAGLPVSEWWVDEKHGFADVACRIL